MGFEDDAFGLNHYDVDRAYNHVFNHLVGLIENRIRNRDERQYRLAYCESEKDDGTWGVRSAPTGEELDTMGLKETMSLVHWRPNIDDAGATLREIMIKILGRWKQNKDDTEDSSDDTDSSDDVSGESDKNGKRWTPYR